MQWLKTERDTLLRPLQIVSGIVERRHTLPILANVLMTKKGAECAFLATDLELQITTHVANIAPVISDGADEEAAITVSARKLCDILRAVPSGEVMLALADQRLTIHAGKSRFVLQTLAAEEFPTMAQATEFSPALTVAQKTFRQLLGCTYFAMAQQDVRYYLNGMLLVIEAQKLTVVATDTHRLACASVEVDSAAPQEMIIPRKTILELQRLLEERDAPLEIDYAPGQVRFRFGQVALISKLVDGKFPDFRRVIPQGYTRSFTLKRETFQQALIRAAILTSDKFKGVRCSIMPSTLKIISTNADQEEAHEELDISYDGEAIEIGFNVTYLLDVLANVKADTLHFSLGDASASALMTLPGNADFQYVVMPMRI
jgi:DNA polymerase III subunit beta